MAPRKPKKQEPEFPPGCCAGCSYAHRDDEGELYCYSLPPSPSYEEGTIIWRRGAAVDDNQPACIYFKPRLNA